MKQIFSVLLLAFSFLSSSDAQSFSHWKPIDRLPALTAYPEPWVTPQLGEFYVMDIGELVQQLQSGKTRSIQLPIPGGDFLTFNVTWSPCAEPGYYAQHPQTGTYTIQDPRNQQNIGQIDHTVHGFHAMFFLGERTIMIDPVYRGRTDIYAVYAKDAYWSENEEPVNFSCDVNDAQTIDDSPVLSEGLSGMLRSAAPADLVTYRLCIATTGEYAQFHGGTKSLVSAEILTAVNRINLIMKKDMGIRLELIADNDKVIYLDPVTDGYSNGDTELMINQNPSRIALFIPLDGYDIGHVFGVATNGQVGLAQLGSVCTTSKARGVSGLFTPKFDPFYISVISHEMGHQFSATHSFNKCLNENPGTGWEPGGGSTIMGYGGACGSNTIKNEADDYYHGGSLGQMKNFIMTGSGAQCGERIPTTNIEPEVAFSYSNGFYIPILTPFKLKASGTDDKSGNLTFCWEGMDTGPITDAGSPVQTSPLFRTFPPVNDSVRIFPRMNSIVQKLFNKFEYLPDYSREMSFRVSVRDNDIESGGLVQKDLLFHASELAGPFTVTSFATTDTVRQGEYVEITWNVAGTDASPVNCKAVNIRLSLDGGYNYPYFLANEVPNSGSFWVTIPKVQANTCRVMVEAADNIFFNISDANLRILPALEPGYTLEINPYSQKACIPEIVEIRINTESLLGFNEPITLSIANGLPPGAVAYFDQSTILAPAEAILFIELAGVINGGTYPIQIQAESTSGITLLRPAELIVVRSDYSTLSARNPLNGSGAVSSSPLLTWVKQADAETYRVELATSPAFGNSTIVQSGILTDTFFQVLTTLAANTLYFWRVLPENSCGSPQNVSVFAFHTASISCTDFSNNTSMFIPSQGVQTIHSTISVPFDGIATEIRIPTISGNHQNIGQLRGTLKSPSGKKSKLFTGKCYFIAGSINLGFNDESLVPFSCPPDKAQIFKSEEPLSNLSGESIQGEWTLTIEDFESGSGGQLANWTLSLCSAVSITNPFLVRKDTLFIAPGKTKVINAELLLADDQDNFPWELTYTIVKEPVSGTLRRSGINLVRGDKFTQQDLYDGYITYESDLSSGGDDAFYFTVQDGEGGWIGITAYPILNDASVSTSSPFIEDMEMTLVPNPARDEVWIRIADQELPAGAIRMYNNLGQLMATQITGSGQDQIRIPLSDFPAGLYFIEVSLPTGIITRRLVVAR